MHATEATFSKLDQSTGVNQNGYFQKPIKKKKKKTDYLECIVEQIELTIRILW